MQLNFAPAIALLAAVSPALASSPLVPQLQQLTQGISNTREIFDDMTTYTILGEGPVSNETMQMGRPTDILMNI